MKKAVFLLLTLIFLFSSLNLTDMWNVTGNYLVYVFITSMLIIPLFIKKEKMQINFITLITIYFFALSCVVSSLVNNDFKSTFGSMMLVFLYAVSFMVIPLLKININKTLVYAVLISHIPLIIIPIIINGVNTTLYSGMFFNPNSFGLVAATIFSVIFACFLGNAENLIKGNQKQYIKMKMFIQGLSLLLIFYLVVISSSRTSLGVIFICAVIGGFYLAVHAIKQKKFFSFLAKGVIISIFVLLSVTLFLKLTSLYDTVYYSLLYKFETRFAEGNSLSGRGEIWKQTMTDAGAFGEGNNYFVDMGIGAHNTFISILGQYGWVTLITFISFLLICLLYSAKYSLINIDDKYKYLPLMMFISFTTMSMGEDVLFSLSMLVLFFSLGSTLKRKEILQMENEEVRPSVRGRRKLAW